MINLTEYDSDAEAGLAGVPIGGYYLTSNNHDTLPGGIVKKRKA